jgi:hypothetical protein
MVETFIEPYHVFIARHITIKHVLVPFDHMIALSPHPFIEQNVYLIAFHTKLELLQLPNSFKKSSVYLPTI